MQVSLPRPHAGQFDVLDKSKRFTVLMCGRRFGKTTLAQYVAARTLIRDAKPVGWFAPTYKLLSDVWRSTTAAFAPITANANVQERRIELVNWQAIDFWSLDHPDPARGRKYGMAIIDECGIVRNLADAWQGAIRPTLADYVGGAWFLGTPKGYGPFAQLFAKGQSGDPDWASFRRSTRDNPFIPPAEIEAMRRDMPEAVYRQEVEGQPIDGGTNPFGVDAIRANIRPFSVAPPVVFGVDLAQREDWTVVVGLDQEGAVCRFDRWQNRPWPETMARVSDLIGTAPALVDQTGVGTPIVEDLARRSPNVQGFTFTRPSKQQLMGTLALAIQRGEVKYPDGPIVAELESFEATYSASGVAYSAPQGLHDDCVCALALAVQHMERARRPIYAATVDSGDRRATPDAPEDRLKAWLAGVGLD